VHFPKKKGGKVRVDVRRIRLRLGWPQSELAGFLGASPSEMSKIESGKRKLNTKLARRLARLAQELDFDIEERASEKSTPDWDTLEEARKNTRQSPKELAESLGVPVDLVRGIEEGGAEALDTLAQFIETWKGKQERIKKAQEDTDEEPFDNNRLRSIRRNLGWSQGLLAKQLKCSQSILSQVETGKKVPIGDFRKRIEAFMKNADKKRQQ
jgi:transcriptional regulator with XRE-family HTH domain